MEPKPDSTSSTTLEPHPGACPLVGCPAMQQATTQQAAMQNAAIQQAALQQVAIQNAAIQQAILQQSALQQSALQQGVMQKVAPPATKRRGSFGIRLIDILLLIGIASMVQNFLSTERPDLARFTHFSLFKNFPWFNTDRAFIDPQWTKPTKPVPLIMQGGDPYLRALMRTISASESNGDRPYSLLYGGTHFASFTQHPDECVLISWGPNKGNCTTAAGRYQFLTTTWQAKAAQYHPAPSGFALWESYSFDPVYQDIVVYRWLSDASAWDEDLVKLLYAGHIEDVLRILSPTWTSLGYGIEPNSMTDQLPSIYQEMLTEELKIAETSPPLEPEPAL